MINNQPKTVEYGTGMASKMSLSSVVIGLRCLKTDIKRRSLGHAAQSLLLRSIHPDLFDKFDQSEKKSKTDSNPYTVSPLFDGASNKISEKKDLLADHLYWLRFTTLDYRYTQALDESISQNGQLSPGNIVDLDGIPFEIVMVATRPDQHYMADQSDFGSLAMIWWYGQAKPERKISFDLLTPTFFKKTGKSRLYVPLPFPELLFGNLLSRWNDHSALKLPDEIKEEFKNQLVFSRYDLHTEKMSFKGGSIKIGALGEVTYEAPYADERLLLAINLLANFSQFAPVGMMTSMGFGQIRYNREQPKPWNNKRK